LIIVFEWFACDYAFRIGFINGLGGFVEVGDVAFEKVAETIHVVGLFFSFEWWATSTAGKMSGVESASVCFVLSERRFETTIFKICVEYRIFDLSISSFKISIMTFEIESAILLKIKVAYSYI